MLSSASDRHAARIRALDEAWLEAAMRPDLDGMMAIYAPDAQELLPDMQPLVGLKSIRNFYQNLIEQFPRFVHHFEPQQILVGAAGDLAVVRGAYHFTPDSSEPSRQSHGKFVGEWRQSEGDWRLVLNISNSDQPTM